MGIIKNIFECSLCWLWRLQYYLDWNV